MPVSETLLLVIVQAGPCAAALGAGLLVLLSCRAAIRQTTLLGAWWWAVAAVCAWAGVELAVSFSHVAAGSAAALRLAAQALTFCPVIAVLGAKRPQHLAWNLVVLSLWAIVVLPAAENYLLHRGQRLTISDARGHFLWLLILLGPINYLPTRYWLASLLLAAGQAVALHTSLPLLRTAYLPSRAMVGLGLIAAALIAGWVISRRKARGVTAFDRLWLDFRDTFGLFWSLRVQQRINELATQNGWDLQLSWSGFQDRANGQPLTHIDPAVETTLRTSLKGLLRRFVSNEWINCRLA